jgi:hypothetical protein
MHELARPLALDRASHLDHCIFHLKNGASEGTLAPIIDAVRVCPVVHQQLDELSVSMIRRKHELVNPPTRYQHMSW